MELAPAFKARRHRQIVQDSIKLAMDANHAPSASLLIDTAIESARTASGAEREARASKTRH